MKLSFSIMMSGLALCLGAGRGSAAPAQEPVAALFSRQADAIVVIGAQAGKDSRLGSGFVLSPDGYIATNFHLVQNARSIFVKLRNNTGYALVRIVACDPARDIALLKVDGHGLQCVSLGRSWGVKAGERVVSIGAPLGLESTVSDGLISGLRHTDSGMRLFQISVPLSSGSSGGPLFGLDGKVIGITTASMSAGQNLNFAVPIEYLLPLLPRGVAGQGDQQGIEFYTVQPNDTLYSLSKRFAIPVDELMALNHLSNTTIYKGQKIKVAPRKK